MHVSHNTKGCFCYSTSISLDPGSSSVFGCRNIFEYLYNFLIKCMQVSHNGEKILAGERKETGKR